MQPVPIGPVDDRPCQERQPGEAAPPSSDALLRAITDSAQDAILMMDPAGRISYWNPGAERILGYRSGEALGRDLHAMLAPERFHAAHKAAFAEFQKTGQGAALGKTLDLAARRKDGVEIAIQLSLSAVQIHGAWHAIGIIRDITAQQRIARKLTQQAAFARFNPNPVLELSASGKIIYANRAAAHMARALGRLTLDGILPDGAAEVVRECLAAGQPRLRLEIPLAGRVISWSFFPVSESQTVHAYAGDVTERRQIEDRLRQLSRAVEQSPASIVITDPAGAIEYVNPKFEQVTGYTLTETLGRNPRILKSGDKSAEAYRELWQTITAGREWRGEFHNKKKNGELYWESASISPIRDAAGKITHFVAVKEDITARKQTEAERERLIAELQQALAEVKTLQGIIPICAGCKKIRDDHGYWSQVETYIAKHSAAKFSHGFCPDCLKKWEAEVAALPGPDTPPS